MSVGRSGPKETEAEGLDLYVSVDGVAWYPRERLRRDLISFFAPVVRMAGNPQVRVLVPGRFEDAVTKTLSKGRRVGTHFVAQQPHSLAGAVTVPLLSSGDPSFDIVFSPAFLSSLLLGRRKTRWYFYAHEAAHVLDYMDAFRKGGRDAFFSYPVSVREFFLHWALGVSMEYRAEIWAAGAVDRLIPRGTAISRPAFDSGADQLISALEDVPSLLEGTLHSLADRVMTAREFGKTISPRIWEVLTLAAYTSGRSDALSWDAKFLADLRKEADYRFFFDTWADIHAELRSSAPPAPWYDLNRPQELAKLLSAFCEICGLRFTEVAATFYVGLKPPSFDSFTHPTGDRLIRQTILKLEEVARSDACTHRARIRARHDLVAISIDTTKPGWAREQAQDALRRIVSFSEIHRGGR